MAGWLASMLQVVLVSLWLFRLVLGGLVIFSLAAIGWAGLCAGCVY